MEILIGFYLMIFYFCVKDIIERIYKLFVFKWFSVEIDFVFDFVEFIGWWIENFIVNDWNKLIWSLKF